MRFHIRPRIRRAFRLALRRRDLTDAEIDEELRFHIDMRVAQLVARGLTPQEAVEDARSRFGRSWDDAVDRLHEAGHLREERLAMRERLDAWWHDVRYAARTLVRQRGFALVVTATFALGIGANVTMFGVIDRLLLAPPPGIQDPGEIGYATLSVVGSKYPPHSTLHYPLVAALREDSAVFTQVAAVTEAWKYTMGRGTGAEEIRASMVSGSYFPTLRARAAIGRLLTEIDDRDVNPAAVVLSYGFWERRFGGDRAVIGKPIQIGPRYFTVVGVAERGFTGVDPRRVDAWIPVESAGELRGVRGGWKTTWGSYWIHVIARVRPGVPAELVNAHATAIYRHGREAEDAARRREKEEVRIDIRSILPSEQLKSNPETRIARLLVAVTIIVLLIGCANVANLLLARGFERRREIAVRLALGVSRLRLIRLLLSEASLLAVTGGLVALVVAAVGVRLLRRTLLSDFEWTDSVIDPRLLLVTSVLVALTVLIAGLLPTVSASRPDMTDALKAGGREGGVRRSRVSAALIIMQAALSVVLLVGAGLFVVSLRRVAALNLGYDTDRVLSISADLHSLGYDEARSLATYRSIRERLTSIPGVASVSLSSYHPLFISLGGMSVTVPGRDSLPQASNGGPYSNAISGDYFATLGTRIVEGRAITDRDVETDARVAVLSEPMARAYWPGQSAVGRCVLVGEDSTCTTVIGVAEHGRERRSGDEQRFLIYLPATERWGAPEYVLLARSRGNSPESLVGPIRRAAQSVSPDLPYVDVRPLTAMMASQLRPWKLGSQLFSLFGGLAALIAALGLYSAISYSVTRRRHEFGVRRALGAQIADVVQLVLGQGVRAAAMGIVLGLVAALGSARFVRELLFETSPRNPVVLAAVAATMLVVAIAATLIPAWRASRVDPVSALRAD
jgi:predicted permease